MNDRIIDVRSYTGLALRGYLDTVAALRVAVFRDWPYLYEGNVQYERDYLDAYARSEDSVLALAFDRDRVVGASTGLPLRDGAPMFQAPFSAQGHDPNRVFYFGESVLLPEFRGLGIGHAFFNQRESYAQGLSRFDTTAFCAVNREANDPRRPKNHRGNELFWTKRGYVRQPDIVMQLMWNEIGRGEIEHSLTFWTRAIGPTPRN